MIKSRSFLHFSPNPPIPDSPQIPSSHHIPPPQTNLHCHFLQRYIYTVWIFFMWTTHLAIKKEERNGYGSGTSLWNKLHIQVSLWFYYVCGLLCSRNILREFILWISVFAFCFILFRFFLSFQQKWLKNLNSTKFVSFYFDFFPLFYLVWFVLSFFKMIFMILLFHGNKFFPLDMTEISAVKAIFCLRSRTEIRNATCVNF